MSIKPLLIITTVLIGSYAITGCGSGQERRSETVATSAVVPVDVNKAKQDLDAVVTSLRNLRDASDSADLKKLHGELKNNREQLNSSVQIVIDSSKEAVAAGMAQQKAWHKESDDFTDAGLRSASKEREAKLREQVEELKAANTTLTTEWKDFSSLMKQTIGALDLDLTQPGLKSIKPTIEKLIDREATLRDALTAVSEKGQAMNSSMSK